MDDFGITDKSYTYGGVLLQRLNKDMLWYAIYENRIVNWSQYRHDLESWIDNNIKQSRETVNE